MPDFVPFVIQVYGASVYESPEDRGGPREPVLEKGEGMATIDGWLEAFLHGPTALWVVLLVSQALGLGGYPNFARHEFGWFQALGFRMGEMPASEYLGANRLLSTALRLLGRDQPMPYPLGLERGGEILVEP